MVAAMITVPRYRMLFTDALRALPYLEDGDGLGWDPDLRQWRMYALRDGTTMLEPELIRLRRHFVAVSLTGLQIMQAGDLTKSLH